MRSLSSLEGMYVPVRGTTSMAVPAVTGWDAGGLGADNGGFRGERFRLPAQLKGLGERFVHDDVFPPDRCALGDVIAKFHVVCQGDRQGADSDGVLGRDKLAPDREPTFAVEEFARLEVFLGGGNDVA